MRLTITNGLLVCTAWALVAAFGAAAPIVVPPDLHPGDQYRVAFVTSTKTPASASNIEFYNDYVTSVANSVPSLSALATSWTVIGSTIDVDARDNTHTNPVLSVGFPVYNLAGIRIANDNADLWNGSLLAHTTLSYDESGNNRDVGVWTGTATNGVDANSLVLGSHVIIVIGRTSFSNGSWIAFTGTSPNQEMALYGMSDLLTVPVPEPSTVALAAVGLVALVGVAVRRARRAG